jgi:peptide/nickel transport system permease protein
MRRFLLRRLALMVPTFLGITALTFAVAQWAPGDPLQLDPELGSVGSTAQARHALGLDRPVLVQYGVWLGRVVQLDFGRSLLDHRPVSEKLARALPRTLLLSGLALLFAWGLALPLGVFLAVRPRSRLANLLSALLAVAWGVPSFWVAVLLLLVFASPRALDWFPFQGLSSDASTLPGALDVAWHLVLPVACLTYPTLALATRHVRAAVSEAMAQEYVRAARARGVPEGRVIWRYGVRNALVPLVTLAGLNLPHLFGGSVVIERVFGIPGMGLLAFDAIGTRDFPVVMAATTVMGLATLVAMLLVDVSYGLLDPRVREGGR